MLLKRMIWSLWHELVNWVLMSDGAGVKEMIWVPMGSGWKESGGVKWGGGDKHHTILFLQSPPPFINTNDDPLIIVLCTESTTY